VIINRATIERPTLEGRTLEGIAYRYDHPSRVSDDGVEFYNEAFGFGCDAKTIADRAAFPLGWWHPWSSNAGKSPTQPLGSVEFRPSKAENALLFTAGVSRTRLGDEALELVRDRAAEDVSVSYKPISSLRRRRGAEYVTVRTEIKIRELSLAPTGLGLHDDAKVLVMRAAGEDLEPEIVTTEISRLEQSRRRLLLL
jgi:hypothetical protein